MGSARRIGLDVAALAGATLLLEGTLLRLLAVAQFYHFAFLVVSLALLGFGASGALLSLAPRLRQLPLARLLPWAGLAFAAAAALSYGAVNWLPFDSYSIAWERRQILYFALYYLALTLPFLASGVGIGAALAASGPISHRIYAANLLGSALGALLAPAALAWAGVPGAVIAAGGLGLVPAWRGRARRLVGGVLAAAVASLLLLGWLNLQGRGLLGMTISPYKGLAHAQRYPGATRIFGAWNAIARVDVMRDAGTRQLPGLSYSYPATPPEQHGLALDAGALQPVTLVDPASFDAAAYLPEALAYRLRPEASVLILEPGAGLGVLQALAGGAGQVTAVVENRLVRRAVAQTATDDPYADPRVQTIFETGRVFAQRDRGRYDLVILPLTDPYQPVTSGAYSLAETYNLTVEAFRAMLARLGPDGMLVVTRWWQLPPSESVRLAATLAEALAQRGPVAQTEVTPDQTVVIYRGIQTFTALVQPDGWSAVELAEVRRWLEAQRFDLVWAPDIRPDEVNRFNRLPKPVDYTTTAEALTGDRQALYRDYPFAVAPARDDHPFFHHYFRWRQTPEVLATLGRTWQPFGGSGYFLLLALLALVVALSAGLILAPLALMRPRPPARAAPLRILLYFGCIGLAFLLVEIPLIQRWILLLGHPTYAFAAVVVALLVFSSAGSLLARAPWLRPRPALALLVVAALLTPILTDRLIGATLGWPLALRVVTAAGGLAPLAVLMGLPFPLGLAWLEEAAPAWAPWAWAVNGCASVIAGVLAAILALSYGFAVVLALGAACYAGAWLARYGRA